MGRGFEFTFDPINDRPKEALEFARRDIKMVQFITGTIGLRADLREFEPGATVSIKATHDSIRVEPTRWSLPPGDDANDHVASVRIEINCLQAGVDARIEARVGERVASVDVRVEKLVIPSLEGGFAFLPSTKSIQDGSSALALILARPDVIAAGTLVQLECANENFQLSKSEIHLEPIPRLGGKLLGARVRIRAVGVGQVGQVVARAGKLGATLALEVVSQVESKGLFSGPIFSDSGDPKERSHYDAKTGKIVIHVNAPTVARYFGRGGAYMESTTFQLVLADVIVAEVSRVLVQQKVERGSFTPLNSEHPFEELSLEAQKIAHKYGEEIHRSFVSESMLQRDRAAP